MTQTKAKPVAPPNYVLDRREAVPALIGNHKDFLIVAGLAGTAKDFASLTSDGPNYYGLAGAMGAAVSMGLGLALARPDKRVLVAAGARMLRESNGTCFVLLRVKPEDPPSFKRNMDAGAARVRFRMALLGQP